jgi:hypothetical protein
MLWSQYKLALSSCARNCRNSEKLQIGIPIFWLSRNLNFKKKIRPESLESETDPEFCFRLGSQKSEPKIEIPNLGGEAGGCQITLFGWGESNEVDCCIVAMILHHQNCVCRSIFDWAVNSDVSFGNVVARTVHANVRLRCQSWEHETQISRNINLRIDIGSMRWDRKSAILGGAQDVVHLFFLPFFGVRGA